MKTILVTGASGFIGSQAISILQQQGHDIHAVASQPVYSTHVTWHQADLLNHEQRSALFEIVKPSHVLHFAWVATPGIYWASPLNHEWEIATRHLLELSRVFRVERFVGAGTCAEYDWSSAHCDDVSTPLNPSTLYGKAKAACGQAVIGTTEISTAWGRIFFLYGPREHPKRLVPSVILSLLKDEIVQCTHGTQIRDFLHVYDVASAFVALLESSVTGAVNIASGEPITIRAVVEMLREHIDPAGRVAFGALASSETDPIQLTAATDRLTKEVGWKPSFSLSSGLQDAIAWWQAQRYLGRV